MTLREAVTIGLKPYATHSNFTLAEWFEAREICRRHSKEIAKIVKPLKESEMK